MAFSSGSGKGPMADINVTPLVDVMLVLLIIFIVTAPIMTYPIDVALPQFCTVSAFQLSGAARFLLIGAELGHAFHQLGQPARLAEKLRLGILQIGRRGGTGKAVAGALNQVAKVFGGGGGTHRCSGGNVF